MATAANPVNVNNGSRAGLLSTALAAMALIALIVLTLLGILFYINYTNNQAAKKNAPSTVQIQAPDGSSAQQGGTGAGTGSASRSGSTGTGASGGAGGAGGSGGSTTPVQGGDTIQITVPNPKLPNVGQ